MDKGAHFYRCDFQVHTPRDINWTGTHYESAEDRKAFASTFVEQCRDKGLDAVAITDHHDLAFFPYIREAAGNELTEDGQPLPDEQKLIVFPGMELTLNVPCQALLILDADFESELLEQLYPALSINAAPANEAMTSQTEQLPNTKTLAELCDRLDALKFMWRNGERRYIVLPNIGNSGSHSMIRKGMHQQYAQMPCVGGYVDGLYDKVERGKKDIHQGKHKDYGFKRIACYQTSDNRREDGHNLGTATTWVKWAKPTAEALRQASLAADTRVSHEAPTEPSLVILALNVSNSKFMGPIDVEFNSQFNCIIGGRGTGKSTILEYLRWALCDQPSSSDGSMEIPDFQAKRRSLIEKTLKDFKSTVQVRFMVNGVLHSVRRKAEDYSVWLKVGAGEFEQVREEDIRSLLAIDAYSQKQLSAVGVRTDELLRFIEAPVKKDLADIAMTVEDLEAKIKSSYGLINRRRQLEGLVDRHKIELDSLVKQKDELQTKLTDLPQADRDVLSEHERYRAEQTRIETWGRELEQLADAVATALEKTTSVPSAFEVAGDLPNQDLLDRMSTIATDAGKATRDQLMALQTQLQSAEVLGAYQALKQQWQAKQEAHAAKYAEVRERATAQQKVLDEVAVIEKRIEQLGGEVETHKESLSAQGDPQQLYMEARQAWVDAFKRRAELLSQRCVELTELSDESIRAALRRGAGTAMAREALVSALEGSGIRGQSNKIDELLRAVEEATVPADAWQALLPELEKLAVLVADEAQTTVDTADYPLLSSAGFNAGDLARVVAKLHVDTWLAISLVELEDVPVFSYRQREADYIPFVDASAGQQATALLRVLLNQEGPPLVIDQPEEDLDNEVIQRIVEAIWKAKSNRQIIVTSHNANIVVNGDADLVVVCAYRHGTDESGGHILQQGAIDLKPIRSSITQVMEGGDLAFQLRKEKYGF